MKSFPKQPAEIKDYDVDFNEWLPTGDSLQSAVATVIDVTETSPETPPLLSLTPAASVNNTAKVTKVWVAGGTDGHTYKVTARTTTAQGRLHEQDFLIKVREV